MANHIEMTKYLSENDEGYKKLSGHLQLIVPEADPKFQLNWDKEDGKLNSTTLPIYSTDHTP